MKQFHAEERFHELLIKDIRGTITEKEAQELEALEKERGTELDALEAPRVAQLDKQIQELKRLTKILAQTSGGEPSLIGNQKELPNK